MFVLIKLDNRVDEFLVLVLDNVKEDITVIRV